MRPIRNKTSPATAAELVAKHFRGQEVSATPVTPKGNMPTGSFLVCGECSEEGGGSSGQCACS